MTPTGGGASCLPGSRAARKTIRLHKLDAKTFAVRNAGGPRPPHLHPSDLRLGPCIGLYEMITLLRQTIRSEKILRYRCHLIYVQRLCWLELVWGRGSSAHGWQWTFGGSEVMATGTCAVLHRENTRAHREDSVWLDEVRRWQAEHRFATGWLHAVESAWSEAEAKLDAHAEAIRAHEQQLRDHEGAIDYSWWKRRNSPERQLVGEHEELEVRHREIARLHDEMKQLHKDAIAEIRELLRTVLSGALVPEWNSECLDSP
jgi:hypothetical protein